MTDASVIKVGQLSIRYLTDGARTGTMGMSVHTHEGGFLSRRWVMG
jgi:hypothetical protein